MKNKNALIISICIFCIVGTLGLLLILNKGHIGNINLVDTSEISQKSENNKIM